MEEICYLLLNKMLFLDFIYEFIYKHFYINISNFNVEKIHKLL